MHKITLTRQRISVSSSTFIKLKQVRKTNKQTILLQVITEALQVFAPKVCLDVFQPSPSPNHSLGYTRYDDND